MKRPGTGYMYINPDASPIVKKMMAAFFGDVTEQVSALFMQEMTGGLADAGPPLSAYSAVVLDESGELSLFAPVLPSGGGGQP
jgi:hypothetical protein